MIQYTLFSLKIRKNTQVLRSVFKLYSLIGLSQCCLLYTITFGAVKLFVCEIAILFVCVGVLTYSFRFLYALLDGFIGVSGIGYLIS